MEAQKGFGVSGVVTAICIMLPYPLHATPNTLARRSNELGIWHQHGASDGARQANNLNRYQRNTYRIACAGSALIFILT